jgi:drug/metabolite transporter (DMT)-like permease
MAATTTLVAGLAVQTAVLLVWLALFDRAGLRAIVALWRTSLIAGFMGALASQLWFVAFALTDAARVRTLALVEVLFAQAASLKLFRERPSGREWLGMTLIVAAAAVLIGG